MKKWCLVVLITCRIAHSVMVLPSATGQEKAAADKMPSPAEQLKKEP